MSSRVGLPSRMSSRCPPGPPKRRRARAARGSLSSHELPGRGLGCADRKGAAGRRVGARRPRAPLPVVFGREDETNRSSARFVCATVRFPRVAASDDTVDVLGRLALFADLSLPALETVAHTLDEVAFSPRAAVLRRDLSGAAFYVIRDGEASVSIDGRDARDARPRRLLRRDLGADRPAAGGRRGRDDAPPLLHAPGPEVEPFLLEHPTVMLRMLQGEARRLRDRQHVAGERSERPFPPGDYGVVVVGSGPGGLQTELLPRPPGDRPRGHLGRRGAGRDVRALPIFERLISPTKPSTRRSSARRASTSATTTTASLAEEDEAAALVAAVHGPHLRRPVARPRCTGARGVRRARGRRASATAAAGSRRAARTTAGSCWRRPTASTAAAPPSSRSA